VALPHPAIAFNIIDSSTFQLYAGEKGIVLDPETTGTLLWQLNWLGKEAQIEDKAAGTVTVPQ